MKAKIMLCALIFSVSMVQTNLSSAAEASNENKLETAPISQDAFESRFDELTALLNWAAYLSGYQTNGINPRLEFKPRQFFVENACNGNNKCRVVGWYNDQDIVYIDDTMVALESRFARSLVVHEFVHYLQHISGDFNAGTCESFVQREREAYSTQRDFIMAYGVLPSMSFHQHSCALDTVTKPVLASHQLLD